MIPTLVTAIVINRTESDLSFRGRLNMEGRRRRDRRIPRIALQKPSMSAWYVLYGSGSDQALLSLTGIDHKAFRYLLNMFEKLYYRYTPYSKTRVITRLEGNAAGRKRSMTARDFLGLSLE